MRTTTRILALAITIALPSQLSAGVYVDSQTKLWPGGVIPYEWDPDMIEANKQKVLDAMTVWEDAVGVQFVVRTNENDYVLIRNAGPGAGSSSPTIGRGGGAQNLNIREDWSDWSAVGITYGLGHELGHVLGFHHAHQRLDRDDYVDVINERIADCFIGNFDPAPDSLAWPRNEMDFDSIMSYGQCVFSICNYDFDSNCTCNDGNCTRWTSRDCGSESCCNDDTEACRAIDIKPPNESFQDSMGQRNHLSEYDVKLMSFLYPKWNWKFVDSAYTGAIQVGTFHQPYKSFTTAESIAPSGTMLWMEGGVYTNSTGVYDKPIVVQATYGSVEID